MSTESETFRFGDVLRCDGPIFKYPDRRVMYIKHESHDSQLALLIKKDPTEDKALALFSIRYSKVGDLIHITARVWKRVDIDADA